MIFSAGSDWTVPHKKDMVSIELSMRTTDTEQTSPDSAPGRWSCRSPASVLSYVFSLAVTLSYMSYICFDNRVLIYCI